MKRFPDATDIHIPYFDLTNTSNSLLKALKKSKDQTIPWSNRDVVFDPLLLKELSAYIRKKSLVAINSRKVDDGEVKYTIKNYYINELSKIVEHRLGESVGINFIQKKH